MYGWRGRIGLLAPSRGDTLLYEFYKTSADGLMAVPYSCELSRLDRREMQHVRDKYLEGVGKLAAEGVDVISVGGTPPQILEGWSEAQKLLQELRDSCKTPLVSSSEAEVDAIHAVGATRIALITPHEEELNTRLTDALSANGITVESVWGAGRSKTTEIGMIPAYEVYRRVVTAVGEIGTENIDGVHITCPRWPTIEILAPLEETLSVPVTSGAQAQLWASYEAIGAKPRKGEWGSLFSVGRSRGRS